MSEEAEKKLVKSEKKLKEARAQNRQLRGEVCDLGQRLADAEQSEDFIKLKELHAQVEGLTKWERTIELPFGNVSLRFYGGQLKLDIKPSSKEMESYYIQDSELCQLMEFGTAIAEAFAKVEELGQLKLRLRPLEKMISDSAEILRPILGKSY